MNNENNKDEVLFNINQVAKVLGVVSTTIRNWEKSGLFIAKRESNNYRVYSLDDIEILKRIQILSKEQKKGSIGIKNMMMSGSVKPPIIASNECSETPSKYSKKLLTSKWKECREKMKLTLEEVSREVNISSSYLSKIENGQANITYEILHKLSIFYGESVLYFFDKEANDNRLIKSGCGEIIEIGLPGVKMESLISQKQHFVFPMMFTVDPGCGSADTHRHHGEEFMYIFSGKLQITLNYNDMYILKKGDSMYFKSFEYHSWTNTGKTQANFLWVHSPIEINK